MAGCVSCSSQRRSAGSANTRARSARRSRLPSAASTSAPKCAAIFGQQRRAGRHHFARQQVGVDDGDAERGEQIGDGGFAAGDAAGEPHAEAARHAFSVRREQCEVAVDDVVAGHQREPAGDREERAERDLRVLALALADHDVRRRRRRRRRTRTR